MSDSSEMKKETDVKVSTKIRKKEIRNAESFLKSIANLSAEEKYKVLAERYLEVNEENRTTGSTIKALEKQVITLSKEKDQLQQENGKSLLARSRLEDLCRELQRQNKAVKEESMARIREEEERRKQISTKFQSTLSEVSTLLQQNTDRNQKLKDENTDMASKLQMLCDQYAVREQNLEKLAKQYDIERQLNEATLAKVRMESAESKEKLLTEKQHLLMELTEYQKKCQAMQLEEVGLREQLTMYTEKYNEFQQALKSSNQQFFSFKTQMDGMTKKLKTLEKETAAWKQRWEKSNTMLIEMVAEKKLRDQEILTTVKQVSQLEKLCRALQTERAALLSRLKTSDSSKTDSVDTAPVTNVQNGCNESPVEDLGPDLKDSVDVPQAVESQESVTDSTASDNFINDPNDPKDLPSNIEQTDK